nr:ChaC-like family protein [Tanacetum cinerariifolium]
MASRFRSNVDHTRLISKSIFVTNFPDNITSKDLWEVCQGYETVVDVYIPNRKSKAGNRFAFVRFIKVENVDRLIGNLCTLWIGRKDCAKITKKQSKPDKIEHEIAKNAQKPDQMTFSVQKSIIKSKSQR